MKIILPLLVLLPFMSYGQNESTDKLTLIHAAKTMTQPPAVKSDNKKKQKDDHIYVGDVKFQIGTSVITCDSAIMNENDGILSAYSNVKLTNPESFDIKGDRMTFTKETKKGFVAENVVVTAKNNTVVGTSDYVEIDFSDDVYHIGKGTITTPQPVK